VNITVPSTMAAAIVDRPVIAVPPVVAATSCGRHMKERNRDPESDARV
jgi:hypothetical protein